MVKGKFHGGERVGLRSEGQRDDQATEGKDIVGRGTCMDKAWRWELGVIEGG